MLEFDSESLVSIPVGKALEMLLSRLNRRHNGAALSGLDAVVQSFDCQRLPER